MAEPMNKYRGVFACVLLLTSGCGLLYTNVHTPHSYRSATPSEVKTSPSDPEVSGRGCDQSFLFLVAYGDASYAAATKNALKNHPDGILYDVKTDVKATAFLLGLYTKACVIVHGRVGRL